MARAVEIVEIHDIPVAMLHHRGSHDRLGESIERFVAWRQRTGLHANTHATYTILYDDPETMPETEFRIDLCVATDKPVAANDDGIAAGAIPGGRYAKLHHVGDDESFAKALSYLCVTWLLQSGARWDQARPLFCQRVAFYPQVPLDQAVTEIYLPLA